ncbi:MAG: NB-ARC domain-containing protein, partial [Aggregatilineales bacterium]
MSELAVYETQNCITGILPSELHLPVQQITPLYPPSPMQVNPSLLIGTASLIDEIVRLTMDKEGNRFISIEGVGGVGKSTLAQLVTHRIRKKKHFKAVLWITIDKQAQTQSVLQHMADLLQIKKTDDLLQLLDGTPYFVVLDNIETPTDAAYVLDALKALHLSQSRFLLTSRYKIARDYPFVRPVALNGLQQHDDRVALIRELLGQQGQTLPDEFITEFAEISGGVPLAIHLMMRLLDYETPGRVLAGLQVAHQPDKTLESQLFTRIYSRLWMTLSDKSRDFLVRLAQHMPAEGIPQAWLCATTGYTESQVADCLQELTGRYLVRLHHNEAQQSILSMHALTIAFIQTRHQAKSLVSKDIITRLKKAENAYPVIAAALPNQLNIVLAEPKTLKTIIPVLVQQM